MQLPVDSKLIKKQIRFLKRSQTSVVRYVRVHFLLKKSKLFVGWTC